MSRSARFTRLPNSSAAPGSDSPGNEEPRLTTDVLGDEETTFDLALDSAALDDADEGEDVEHGRSRGGSAADEPDTRPAPPARGVRAAAEQAGAALDAPVWYERPRVQLFAAGVVLVVLVLFVAGVIGGSNRVGSPGSSGPETDKQPLQYLRIHKPATDRREYRFVQLPSNSLPLLLVSDPSTVAAAASLSVGSGSALDPPAVSGLAHFLEHMLFLGSAAFPDEHEFASFLAAHGGRSNAYTADEETNFFFAVQPDALADALARFAGFFTTPLLRPGAALREMRAVDSEHAKNVLDDGWRAAQLLRTLAQPGSPFNHFGTGTLSSLNRSDIHEQLRDFHRQHYTADNMALVLIGREPLDELQRMATGLFQKVPGPALVEDAAQEEKVKCGAGARGSANGTESTDGQAATQGDAKKDESCVVEQTGFVAPASSPAASLSSRPLPFVPHSAAVRQLVTFVPVSTPSHTLSLYFPLPSSKGPGLARFRQDAAGFLSYTLGHEGSERTLCSLLTRRDGLATEVAVGAAADSRLQDQTLLAVEVTLTPKGNSEQGRAQVLRRVFDAIELLRAASLDQLRQLYATMQGEAQLRWRFAEKDEPMVAAQSLAARMTELLRQHVGTEGQSSAAAGGNGTGLSNRSNGTVFDVRDLLLEPARVHGFDDGAAIVEALSFLTPDNVLVTRSSSDLASAGAREAVAPAGEWRMEPHYGVLYHAEPLDLVALLAVAPALEPTLELPPLRNPFLPDRFDVLDVAGLAKAAEAEGTAADGLAVQQLRAAVGAFDPSQPLSPPLALPPLDPQQPPVASRLFYQPDVQSFGLPYAFFGTLFRLPTGTLQEPVDQLRLQLYLLALGDGLRAARYQLGLLNCKVDVVVRPAQQGFSVTAAGFAATLPTVWDFLLSQLVSLRGLSDARLSELRLELLQSAAYAGYASRQQPYQHALDFQRLWEERGRHSAEELTEALQRDARLVNGTVDELRRWVTEHALPSVGLAALAYGSLNISEAQRLHRGTEAALEEVGLGAPLGAEELDTIDAEAAQAVFQLPLTVASASNSESQQVSDSAVPASYLFRHAVLNTAEQNSALLFNLQLGPTGGDGEGLSGDALSERLRIRRGVLLQLLSQLLGEAAFSVLRTQWSLGYLLWAIRRESPVGSGGGRHGVSSFTFLLQNARESPRFLEARVEEFLLLFRSGQLAALSEPAFQQQVESLGTALKLQQAAKGSMAQHFERLWAIVQSEPDRPLFQREEAQLEALGEVMRADLLDFFDEYFATDGASRRKSVMLLYGAGHNATEQADMQVVARESEQLQQTLTRGIDLGAIAQREAMRVAQRWAAWPV